MFRLRHVIICLLATVSSVSLAQDSVVSEAVSIGTVGECRLTLKLPELTIRDASLTKPGPGRPFWLVSCEVIPDSMHKDGRRTWLLRYSAWKAGEYDLRPLLKFPEGMSQEMFTPIIVTVMDSLPADYKGNLEQPPRGALNVPLPPGAFWRRAIYGSWAGVLLLLAYLGWFRRTGAEGGIQQPGDAARRKLLEGLQIGARSQLTPQTRADLQRQFLALINKDFTTGDGSMQERLNQLQAHPQAGPLMAQFDEWVEAVGLRPARPAESIMTYLEDNPTDGGIDP